MGAPLLGRIIDDESIAGSLKEQVLQFACGLEILRHPSLSAMDGVSIEVKDEELKPMEVYDGSADDRGTFRCSQKEFR